MIRETLSNSLHNLTLTGMLSEFARSYPTDVAVVDGDVRLTFAQLHEQVHQFANALEAAGVGRGDRILWIGGNAHQMQMGIIAAAAIGALLCPVDCRQTVAELAFVIDDLAPMAVITEEGGDVGQLGRASRTAATHRIPICLALGEDGAGGLGQFIQQAPPTEIARVANPAAPCMIIYTAAFGGTPNGAMLSQSALIMQGISVARMYNISRKTVFLASAPMFHIGVHMFFWATFVSGGKIVYSRGVDPQNICELVESEKITKGLLFPKTVKEIIELNRDGRYDLSSLATQSMNPEWDAMVTIDPTLPGNGYGQTEVCGFVVSPYYGPGRGPQGRPAPIAQLRIVDEDGNDQPSGEVGEMVIRGATVMNGYWNRPELTAQRQRGGWHHTNDLGRREIDGTITFIGSKTQMIKSGTENIYPAEVEGCLKTHHAVADCAVIGVPDTLWHQSVKAIVVLRAGESVSADDLVERCKASIASYKKPKFVEFADKLPRTPTGMLDYESLDRMYGGGNYPGSRPRSG